MLYYNKDLFDKANVPYPSNDMTWDEYEEAGTQDDKRRKETKKFTEHTITTGWL